MKKRLPHRNRITPVDPISALERAIAETLRDISNGVIAQSPEGTAAVVSAQQRLTAMQESRKSGSKEAKK